MLVFLFFPVNGFKINPKPKTHAKTTTTTNNIVGNGFMSVGGGVAVGDELVYGLSNDLVEDAVHSRNCMIMLMPKVIVLGTALIG